jgi:hypothetical protein
MPTSFAGRRRKVAHVVCASVIAGLGAMLLLQPAEAAANLKNCYAGTGADATSELLADKAKCAAATAANRKALGAKALVAAEVKCNTAATMAFNAKLKSIASVRCGKAQPATSSVKEFCAAARRYLALDLTLPDKPDHVWLKYVTQPLYDMAVAAPKDLRTTAAIVVMSEFGTRRQMLNAIDDLANQDFDRLRTSLAPALNGVKANIENDATEFPLLIAGVTRYCGFDMQAEINKIIAAASRT